MSLRTTSIPFPLLFVILLLIPFIGSAQLVGKVTYVSDGDTFYVQTADGVKYRVRVADIDTPEKTQAFGLEAKEFTMSQIDGKTVKLEVKNVDRYGRQVAFVKYDGKDLSEELIKAGFAWHYKQYSTLPQLGILEAQARKAKLGMWVSSDNVAPWEFRKSN